MKPLSLSHLELEKRACGSIKGSGGFSIIYEGISPDTVIKRGKYVNDGWLIWALYCMKNRDEGHSCLPKIQMLHVDFSKCKFTAMMELLEEVYYESFPFVQYIHGEEEKTLVLLVMKLEF